MALSSGVATAAVIDNRPTAAAPADERPSATPPHVHGEPTPQMYGAPGAAAANRPPNTPKGPEVGPPFTQTGGVWQTTTLTPTFRNTVTDPDGNKTTSTFEAWTVKADGTPGTKVNLTDANQYDVLVSGYVANNTAASVTVPQGKLKDGATYMVRSSAYDGSAYETDWSPWSKFKVTVPPVIPPVKPGGPYDDPPADVKAKWQQLAKEALASYDAEQKKITDIKAHGLTDKDGETDGGAASAQRQLTRDHIALPDNGYYGVPREFMAARVYDDRTPSNNPTVTTVGGCDSKGVDLLHCTQKFRLDYVLSVDTFYCTTPGVAAGIGSKCAPGDMRWTGFHSESQSEEFTREYNRITDGWDKFISQTLGDMPKTFLQCVSGDTSGEPPVIARVVKGAPRATADQCTETGMQLGSMYVLGKIGTSAKVTADPKVNINWTAEQIGKAKIALNDLKTGIASSQYNRALTSIIESAIKADQTAGLSESFTKIVNMPAEIKGMPANAAPLMKDFKEPFGKLTIEEWFHKYWDKNKEWGMRYPDAAAGFPQGFTGPIKPHYAMKGEFMDRFGGIGGIKQGPDGKWVATGGGGYLAPRDGTPYSQRALPPNNVVAKVDDWGGYHVYKWLKDWTTADAKAYGEIQGGKIAPWFEQPGGGTQYLLPEGVNVAWLLKHNYIVEVK
ncbi:glycohydrolase toxin TNT-related protein [Streptomyces violascens]|uniref:TNT domain-containing protein n=1 Tax=Streptomyces violascens TaxID=67381 RepID=UPI0037A5D836